MELLTDVTLFHFFIQTKKSHPMIYLAELSKHAGTSILPSGVHFFVKLATLRSRPYFHTNSTDSYET